jgi:ribosomal protein S18 acetylase RimI-like enzyme
MVDRQTRRPAGIRPYRVEDRAAVYDVCVRTACSGRGVQGEYSTDDLVPDVFAGPYLQFEPELAFVLDDGDRPAGYVLGTSGTARFAGLYRTQWVPLLGDRYAEPPKPPAAPEQRVLAVHYRPERMLWHGLEAYAAHLHVDILPPYQGMGHGRGLIEAFLGAAADAGAPGVHVGVGTDNVQAIGFCHRLGFHQLDVPDRLCLGRRTL